jgi:hypothetical protein
MKMEEWGCDRNAFENSCICDSAALTRVLSGACMSLLRATVTHPHHVVANHGSIISSITKEKQQDSAFTVMPSALRWVE